MKTIGSIVFDKTAIYGIVASGAPENPSIHKTVYLNRTENQSKKAPHAMQIGILSRKISMILALSVSLNLLRQ